MALQREDERDVDRDARCNRCLDRTQPWFGRGNLHVEILSVNELVQAAGLCDRGIPVISQAGVDLQGHLTVEMGGALPCRPQKVTGVADVALGERQEHLFAVGRVLEDLAELLVVGAAVCHRLLEDRRV